MRTTLNPSLVVHIRFHFNHFYDTPRVTVIFMLTTLPGLENSASSDPCLAAQSPVSSRSSRGGPAASKEQKCVRLREQTDTGWAGADWDQPP